ncbi:MAG: GTP-binding protein [Candidatus Hodarchaeales archaeon]
MFEEYRKVVVIGDAEVGKTAIIKSMLFDEFLFVYRPTVRYRIYDHVLMSNNGKKVLIAFWDISGQEIYARERETILTGSEAGIIVIDSTNKNTMENLSHWLEKTRKSGLDDERVIICMNKVDLRELVVFSIHELEIYLLKSNFKGQIYEVSARKRLGLKSVIRAIQTALIK